MKAGWWEMGTKSLDDKLIILHKYFLNASSMRSAFNHQLIKNKEVTEHDPQTWSYMTLWYGCLCVVAEAWLRLNRENGVKESNIDTLLQSPNFGLLNTLRNDVFHVTNWKYFNDKTMYFIKSPDSVSWVTSLHDAFDAFFLNWLQSKPKPNVM